MSERPKFKPENIREALANLEHELDQRLDEKGEGCFSSRHEVFGVVAEEIDELLGAVREGSASQVEHELMDIAVACILGIACINDWDW